jgi:hypothetical protein
MDVIEALANLLNDAERVVGSAENEMDGVVIVNLYALQDLAESMRAAQAALDAYRAEEAEAAA